MKVDINDREALLAISPSALSAYARIEGWSRHDSYRKHSDIYIGDTLPEIVVPLTTRLGDYASAVAELIKTFAQVANQDELTVYRALAIADRDLIRIRAAESDDGSLGLDDGVTLVEGAREMVLSAACSLDDPQPVYRAEANRSAVELLQKMQLGQTDQGRFVIKLLTPVLPPPIPSPFEDPDDHNAPTTRRLTRRLVESLTAAHRAVEQVSSGDGDAFERTVTSGVSANLCEALAKLIEPFPTLDVGVSWARTRPMMRKPPVCRFGRADAALLSEAARSFRERDPKPDVHLHGFVRILDRAEEDADGTIRLRTDIDGQRQSVAAVLEQADYQQAVHARKDRALVALKGDFEFTWQGWRLLNSRLESVLRDDEQDSEAG